MFDLQILVRDDNRLGMRRVKILLQRQQQHAEARARQPLVKPLRKPSLGKLLVAWPSGIFGIRSSEKFAHCLSDRIIAIQTADSDEGAQAFRFDGALGSDMMSPRWWSLAGW